MKYWQALEASRGTQGTIFNKRNMHIEIFVKDGFNIDPDITNEELEDDVWEDIWEFVEHKRVLKVINLVPVVSLCSGLEDTQAITELKLKEEFFVSKTDTPLTRMQFMGDSPIKTSHCEYWINWNYER